MRVRKLTAPGTNGPNDPGGDRVFGGDQAAFWINQPEAAGQIVWTRLRLWQGQWFLKPLDGTRYLTKVLGKYTESTRDVEIRTRILTSPGVSGISSYASQLNRDTRAWTVQAIINTIFGPVLIAGPVKIALPIAPDTGGLDVSTGDIDALGVLG